MSRIKIDLPEKFMFSTELPVRIGDINRGKHLGHDRALVIMEEARVQFLKSLGMDEDNMDGTGTAFITVDAGVIYRRQGFYGQTLKIEVAVTEMSNKGCDLVYRISNLATGEEMIRGKTGMLFFDYTNQKVVSMPEQFRQKILELQS